MGVTKTESLLWEEKDSSWRQFLCVFNGTGICWCLQPSELASAVRCVALRLYPIYQWSMKGFFIVKWVFFRKNREHTSLTYGFDAIVCTSSPHTYFQRPTIFVHWQLACCPIVVFVIWNVKNATLWYVISQHPNQCNLECFYIHFLRCGRPCMVVRLQNPNLTSIKKQKKSALR